MKKITTSLTVDGDVVTRARNIIEKSALPFSVSKLVTALIFEAFDRIESVMPIPGSPMVEQLRRAIHGGAGFREDGPEIETAPPPALLAAIDAAIERHLAKLGKKRK